MTNREVLQKAYIVLSPYADAQRWERNNNLVHLRFIAKWIPATSRILDVGCGIGILDMALTFLGYTVTGVDKYVFEPDTSFSVEDLNGLKRVWREQGLSILPSDILEDDVGGQYDAVISIATVEHQRDPKRFLEGLLRAAAPGGFIYLATPNVSHLLNRVRFAFGRSPMQAHMPAFFNRGERYEGHWREYTLRELRQMFEWMGATVVAARNVQSMRPRLKFSSPRSWYLSLFRLCAYMLPGTGDTNIIIARKGN